MKASTAGNNLNQDSDPSQERPRLRIAFVHPDLGIGAHSSPLLWSSSSPPYSHIWPNHELIWNCTRIGGAERLVVDAATGLQERGHVVRIYTSHHDPSHAFPETISTSSPSSAPLLNVQVRGDFLPSSILGGKGYILCAILRNIYLAICLLVEMTFVTGQAYDVIFVDQLSACIPLLRLSPSAKVGSVSMWFDRLGISY